jgi:DNA-binding IclR family transcriptional regulator
LNQQESIEGVTTLSAVFHGHAAMHIVTIAGPASRMDAKLDVAATALVDVCRQLETPSGR